MRSLPNLSAGVHSRGASQLLVHNRERMATGTGEQEGKGWQQQAALDAALAAVLLSSR